MDSNSVLQRGVFLFGMFLALTSFSRAEYGLGEWRVDVRSGRADPPTFYIDCDGDGYGVASPNGIDADDADPNVNTPETVREVHGSIPAMLKHLGYRFKRTIYIATDGDDRKGKFDDPDRPFATWKRVLPVLRSGDAVIFREGRYKQTISALHPPLNATEEDPILVMAAPGERVVIDKDNWCINVGKSQHVIFDGLILDNAKGEYGDGAFVFESRNITFRNIESMHHSRGIIAMQDLHDILIENCVLHDNPQEHGIYLGSRERPNSNITVRRCLSYQNGRHGFQHNGRVKNLVLRGNVFHSNMLAGIAFLQGVSDSRVENNLIFNNNKQGIVFFNYDDKDPNIKAYNQERNRIQNNIIWIGNRCWDRDGNEPDTHAAVEFSHATVQNTGTMKKNALIGNIFVTQKGPVLRFDKRTPASSMLLRENILYRAAGADKLLLIEERFFGVNQLERLVPDASGNRFEKPAFADVSVDYFNAPVRFDFSHELELRADEGP